MRAFLTKLLFKLPKGILIKWSGKEQIQKGYRKLDPGFQYLLKVMNDSGASLDTTKPAADLWKDFEEGRSLISASLPSGIKITDHYIKTNDHEIKIRESINNLEKEEKPYEEIINADFSTIQANKNNEVNPRSHG